MIQKSNLLQYHHSILKILLKLFNRSISMNILDESNGIFQRSTLISFCVPDVYSPGSNEKSSPPPLSSNLPPPPSEWLP